MSDRGLAAAAGRRWAISAVAAVALHLTLVAAFFVRLSSTAPEMAAATAIAIDLAPVPTAPPLPEHNLTTPEQVEAPTPKPQQKPADKPLPFTPPPALTARDVTPELVLPMQPDPAQNTKSSAQPKADQNTREAAPDARPDKKVAAPNEGGFNSGDATPEMLWYAQVMGKVQKFKRYPMLARVRSEQDDVAVTIAIDRGGKLLSVAISRSGGFELLDKESLDVVRRAAPFPEPPAEVVGDVIKLSLIVQFAMSANPTINSVSR